MDTFQGRVTRSRSSIKTPRGTPLKNTVKQEVIETPFKTPGSTMTLRGRKPLVKVVSMKGNSFSKLSKSKTVQRHRISVKKQRVEIKAVSVNKEMEEDCIVPKIVGFMVKPGDKIFYGVSIGPGPVTFVSSEKVKDKIPFALIDFCEKNALWKTRKWESTTDPVNVKPTLAICDKKDWDDEDMSDNRCSIQ